MRNEKLAEIDALVDDLLKYDLDPNNLNAKRIKELVAELDKQDWECTLAAANESAYRVALETICKASYEEFARRVADRALATADRNKTVR